MPKGVWNGLRGSKRKAPKRLISEFGNGWTNDNNSSAASIGGAWKDHRSTNRKNDLDDLEEVMHEVTQEKWNR